MADDAYIADLRALLEPLAALAALLPANEERARAELQAVHPSHAANARNLVHYLALRRQDLRGMQDQLAAVGLSSLGRAESCVEATLWSVLELIRRATGAPPGPGRNGAITLEESRRRLEKSTALLLGPARRSRRVRILVTLPSEAATDATLVRELLRRGMDVARINCAHDDAEAWAQMIENVRREAADLDVPCRVLMDLAGPKLRTGSLAPGPRVTKLKPHRDRLGQVLEPARLWLRDGNAPAPAGAQASVPVSSAFLAGLRVGDRIDLNDARGAARKLWVRTAEPGGALLECSKSVYLQTGTVLRHARGESAAGALAAVVEPLLLRVGDALVLTRDPIPGHAGPPAQISCTLPQVFPDVQPGEGIWFDDGAIGGRVKETAPDRLLVEITAARPEGSKLGADKGINLPDTTLRLPILDADQEDLAFVAQHADLVGYSFVRTADDVLELQERLAVLGRGEMPVVLKIETREAFENLPSLLLAAMRLPAVGVMIARGDLAVELGWQRLAEVQEEILWLCEAASLPVVWATQVLESLAKEGRPSRAEITDAAMAVRAECVMLNKGPHLVQAIEVLDDILRRMAAHQSKKRSMLRPLAVAERFAARSSASGGVR